MHSLGQLVCRWLPCQMPMGLGDTFCSLGWTFRCTIWPKTSGLTRTHRLPVSNLRQGAGESTPPASRNSTFHSFLHLWGCVSASRHYAKSGGQKDTNRGSRRDRGRARAPADPLFSPVWRPTRIIQKIPEIVEFSRFSWIEG